MPDEAGQRALTKALAEKVCSIIVFLVFFFFASVLSGY